MLARMAIYDLLEHQREILRLMVRMYEETGDGVFYYSATSTAVIVFFQAQPGKEQTQINVRFGDLDALAAEGLVLLRYNTRGNLTGGQIRHSAVEAVKNDFQKPVAAAAAGTFNTFYAPVGAFHSGPGNISIDTQTVSVTPAELADAMKGLAEAIASMHGAARAEAAELLDDLQAELRAQVPKQSRVKASLLAIWTVAKDAVAVGANLVKIAEGYGIDPRLFG